MLFSSLDSSRPGYKAWHTACPAPHTTNQSTLEHPNYRAHVLLSAPASLTHAEGDPGLAPSFQAAWLYRCLIRHPAHGRTLWRAGRASFSPRPWQQPPVPVSCPVNVGTLHWDGGRARWERRLSHSHTGRLDHARGFLPLLTSSPLLRVDVLTLHVGAAQRAALSQGRRQRQRPHNFPQSPRPAQDTPCPWRARHTHALPVSWLLMVIPPSSSSQ